MQWTKKTLCELWGCIVFDIEFDVMTALISLMCVAPDGDEGGGGGADVSEKGFKLNVFRPWTGILSSLLYIYILSGGDNDNDNDEDESPTDTKQDTTLRPNLRHTLCQGA